MRPKATTEVQAIRKKVVIFAPDLDAGEPSSWNARELGRRGLTQH